MVWRSQTAGQQPWSRDRKTTTSPSWCRLPPDLTIQPEGWSRDLGDWLGRSLSFADFDGDLICDLVIGAPWGYGQEHSDPIDDDWGQV